MARRVTADTVLHDLIELGIEARKHYQVWWALVHEARLRYRPTMNRFSDYFNAAVRAHFDSMALAIARMYDKKSSTSTLAKYLKLDASSFSARELGHFTSCVTQLAARAKVVLKIRHEAVAHKPSDRTERQVFQANPFKPDEIRELIDDSIDLIEQWRRRKGWNNGVFQSRRFSTSVLGVLEALANSSGPGATRD